MRNRLCIIILLVVWIGQPFVGVPDETSGPSVPWWAIWRSTENVAELVVYQVSRLMPWPPPRTHSRCRSQRSGRACPRRLDSPLVDGDEKEDEEPRATERPQRREDFGSISLCEPQRWGLSPDLSRELPERLHSFWQRYYECFKTSTRNAGEYAYHYLSCLLRMETKRIYTNIGRAAGVAGENIQHFMSNSPWPAQAVMEQVQQEIKATPGLEQGGVLLLDESADKKAGDKSAGAGRQRNGRLGKVDMSQVGTLLAYANLTYPDRPVWTWVDGELYLQKHWFTPEMAELRQQVGIPPECQFETKIEQGWKMIQRVKANGLPFEAVACDDLCGRSTWLRDNLDGAGIIYMADVPRTTCIYLEKPVLGVPERPPGRPGPKPTRLQVVNGVEPFKAHQVARRADTTWQRVRVRPIERGESNDPFAVRRVWTLREGKPEPVEEWLVIRHEAKNRYNYSFCNAPADASLEYLAWLKCQRYFVERTNQDAKSEAGWDELQARKYRGWEHHLALVILAVWFAAQTKWEWAQRYFRDPSLASQFAIDVLPALSMANIRILLRAAMPLPQPSPEEAVELVVQLFINRTRSRASRLRRQSAAFRPNANAPP
jgi:SRSO17 transposase